MSIGLPNGKVSVGGGVQRLGLVSRAYKVTTSIAEKAIFIPKPYKRVEFKLTTDPQLMGSGKSEYAPLPGQGSPGGEVTGGNGSKIAQGNYGTNGLTARFNTVAYGGGKSSGSKVTTQVDMTPSKQTDVIATQEEGRQVNRGQTHFTQQYDSYGRPRIGFSREPYDFAATKFVSVTSQIAFQANMANIHEEYKKYLITGKDINATAGDNAKPDIAKEIPVFGVTSDPATAAQQKSEPAKVIGSDNAMVSDGTKSVSESFNDMRVKLVKTFENGNTAGGESGVAKIAGLGGKATEGSNTTQGGKQKSAQRSIDVTA